jgi:SAM-dependent methyltransferase
MHPDELTRQRYVGDDYSRANPTWDAEDSPWKADLVLRMLRRHKLTPARIVEVGCGAGGVLSALRRALPEAKLVGYDIAPQATAFWKTHGDSGVEFRLEDFLHVRSEPCDVLLLLDVIEHVADPHAFLNALRGRAARYIFHIPLDLSAVSALREAPLLYVRNKVGHIHYFTKGLALALLRECGYEVLDSCYTDAATQSPKGTWRTRLARLPRRLMRAIDDDWGVRLLGGETLLVLARAQPA